ncbi:hypothetical protein BaRGS_00007898 [Batillaria attramentaria]|uniref:Uncharacterized protein n=1 Tax=Batillaria attramentaria TaxID=370345 RepID=A0ABD0LPT3_9CAEN
MVFKTSKWSSHPQHLKLMTVRWSRTLLSRGVLVRNPHPVSVWTRTSPTFRLTQRPRGSGRVRADSAPYNRSMAECVEGATRGLTGRVVTAPLNGKKSTSPLTC